MSDERHPLDALTEVECTHTRHQSMCLQCAADAMRPEVERLRAELEDARIDRRTAEMQRDDYRKAHQASVAERDTLAGQVTDLKVRIGKALQIAREMDPTVGADIASEYDRRILAELLGSQKDAP